MCFSAFSTLSPRWAPPTNAASTFSGSAVQSCAPQCRSRGASTTSTGSTRDTAATASMEWNIIGLPASGMYCLGTGSPMRVPCPAASTKAKTFGMEGFDGGLHYTGAMGARRSVRILALLACLAVGCEEVPKPIPPVAESGELVVLTVNGPSTYFEDAQGLPSGLEYDLATMFAKELGAKAHFILVDNPATIDQILRKGKAHLAAAALARHFDFPGGLAWGPSYLSTQYEVVCREETKAKKLDELTGKRIGVIEETVGDYLLAEPSKLTVPIERLGPETSTADLLEKVANGSLDCALVESTRFTLARRFFPSLEPAFHVGKPLEYAWLVSTVDKKRILDAAGPFFERIRKDGTLKRLIDRYYGHAAHLSAIDANALLEQVASQLEKLKLHFVEAEIATRHRLAAHRGDRIPGVPLGPEGDLAHGRARPHDAHRGNGRPHAGEGPARPARKHPRRRPLPRDAEGADCRRASPSPTRPSSRSPPTTSASATSRTRASSRSARDSIRTSGRTCAR